jgi:hypothetical protein
MFLNQSFGDGAQVDYHDAVLEDVRDEFPGLVDQASTLGWPYPLVLIDDRVVMVGGVNEFRIFAAVAQILETDKQNHTR